jgi:uncharacterized protein with von Willebrand factor type A (vWA) domain
MTKIQKLDVLRELRESIRLLDRMTKEAITAVEKSGRFERNQLKNLRHLLWDIHHDMATLNQDRRRRKPRGQKLDPKEVLSRAVPLCIGSVATPKRLT